MNARRWWIAPIVLLFAAACASGGSQEQVDASVAPAEGGGGECGGRYEIQVRNDTFSDLNIYFMRTPAASAEMAGTVNSRDTRSFFIRSTSLYQVWADVAGVRILVTDQPAQQRAKVYLGVACAG